MEVILSIGTSREGDCGVRDHSLKLETALSSEQFEVHRSWDERRTREGWFAGFRSDLRLIGLLFKARRAHHPQYGIFHYSPFGFGSHGIPLLAPLVPLFARLLGIQLTTFLHELCYPWGRDGLKGRVWAVVQRMWLVPVVKCSSRLVVSTKARSDWLAERYRVPPRKLLTLPVWSNISPDGSPAPDVHYGQRDGSTLYGTFGWGMAGPYIDVVIRALSMLESRGIDAQLLMIGSPGPDSTQGTRWLECAERNGLNSSIIFTGAGREEAEVSSALALIDVAIHMDPAGPDAKSSALAAVLAHGKPVIALKGADEWKSLVEDGAIVLVDADPLVLAGELERLSRSASGRAELGERALAAYLRRMDIAVTGPIFRDFLTATHHG
jgi:glycosyltransferase involved in cell wall biosynthesis